MRNMRFQVLFLVPSALVFFLFRFHRLSFFHFCYSVTLNAVYILHVYFFLEREENSSLVLIIGRDCSIYGTKLLIFCGYNVFVYGIGSMF